MNYKISSKTYNCLQDQEISRIWLNKFTLFSWFLLITFASSFDPGQHRQKAGPNLDSNRRAQRHSKHKTEKNIKDLQKSTALKRSVKQNILLEGLNWFHGANLTLNSDVDQDT